MLQDSRNFPGFARVTMLAAVIATASSPSASLACGYHDDVSLARGILNWVYPDALHVIGAISAAVARGACPTGIPNPQRRIIFSGSDIARR